MGQAELLERRRAAREERKKRGRAGPPGARRVRAVDAMREKLADELDALMNDFGTKREGLAALAELVERLRAGA